MENQRIYVFSEMQKGALTCLKIALIFTLLFSVLFGNEFSIENILISFLISSMYSFGLGFGNGLINVLLDKKWNWLEQTNLRVYFGIIATVLYTVPIVLGINYITFVLLNHMSSSDFFGSRMMLIHVFYIILSLGVSIFMHARGF